MENEVPKEEKKKKMWQNLLHRQCPVCGADLEDANLYLKCPKPGDAGRNCFFIKKDKAVELIQNSEHPANFCLSPYERENLEMLTGKFLEGRN